MSDTKRVLMIDDDANLVSVFRSVFEAKGYTFAAAHSASSGLAAVKSFEPELIILDVIMEDFVAGFRVVSELRAGGPDSEYAPFANVPILMLTSVTTKTRVDFRERVGTALLPVDAFIEKPVKPGELLGQVEKLLAEAG